MMLITIVTSILAVMSGCSDEKNWLVSESGSEKTYNVSAGIKSVQATSTIYTSSFSMIDTISIEYNDEIVLREANPETTAGLTIWMTFAPLGFDQIEVVMMPLKY